MNGYKWGFGVLLLVTIVYFMGPAPDEPKLDTKLPELGLTGHALEQEILKKEQALDLKEDNQARIIWHDSAKMPTPYSVVYLHGFSASQAEGAPIHSEFAKRFGCNLYLSRLQGHGLEEPDAFLNMTPENLLESAKFAVAVGRQIGEQVILMSTSTGGTLSLFLASGNADLHSLIMFSPNIDLSDPTAFILGSHWGLQISRMVLGGKYREWSPSSPAEEQYWTSRYRIEGLVSLRSLIKATMTPATFAKVHQPVYMGYYYRDEENQDQSVSVPAMLQMFDQLGTPTPMKWKEAFPDANEHVIGSKYLSNDWEQVRDRTFEFAEEVLALGQYFNCAYF